MAITYDTSTLKSAINSALDAAAKTEEGPSGARDQIAGDLSKAIEAFVKTVIDSATVEFTSGTVTGMTAVQGAPTPLTSGAASNGKIS